MGKKPEDPAIQAPPAGQDTPGTQAPPEPPPAPKAKAKPAPKTVPALCIRAVPEGGFCRAGRRWAREEVTVPTSDFTPDQVAALKGERNLVVVETTLDAPESTEE